MTFPGLLTFPGTSLFPGLGGVGPGAGIDLDESRIIIGDLDLGSTDSYGVRWLTGTVGGWGSPGSTVEVTQRAFANGGWSSPAYLRPRTITAEGDVFADDAATLSDALDRLHAAVSLQLTKVVVIESGRARLTLAQRQDEVLITWPNDDGLSAHWSIQMVAPDPRKLGDELQGSTHLPSVSGGFTAPFTAPFSSTATIVAGQVSLTNPGNITGPVVLRVNGPVSGPIITHVSSGVQLVFSSSLSLGAGEWLDIDMERKTVLANGTANRAGWITSRGWSAFDPGDNTWAFSAITYNSDASLEVIAAPAWL